ncbi:MAG: ATP-binding cassette domain-containing protein [Clostridium sp.]
MARWIRGPKQGLQDISLTIPKGTVAALVGLSGCGKSTTASLLMRFMTRYPKKSI